MTERQVLACLLAISLLFAALSVMAGSVTFADVCQPTRYVQRGSDLLIYCPGEARPWLTYKGCKGARVTWDRTKTKVKVVCQ
jgi:hypothetical protein